MNTDNVWATLDFVFKFTFGIFLGLTFAMFLFLLVILFLKAFMPGTLLFLQGELARIMSTTLF